MIAILISWIFILIVFFSFGNIFVHLYNKFTLQTEEYYPIETFVIGLCIVGSLISITSIWMPSGYIMALILGIISIINLFIIRKKLTLRLSSIFSKLSPIEIGLSSIVLLSMLLIALMPPQFPDVYFYHIQNILWNEEFHVVPGLANLQERFGFNSNMFLLGSIFGLRYVYGEIIFSLPALCMGLMFIYIMTNTYQKELYKILVFLMVFITLFLKYREHITGFSPDLMPNFLIIFILFVLLINKDNLKNKNILFWLLPIFCITLKVSTVFISLISVYLLFLYIKEKKYRTVAIICTSSLFIILPWLVRNVIISGYLIHPYPKLDLFSFDWKLPKQYSIEAKSYIEAFAITIQASYESMNDILALTPSEKVSHWIREQYYLDKLVVGLALISPFIMIISCHNKKQLKDNFIYIIFWFVCLGGFIFWILTAPAVRFSFGYIIALYTIPIYLLCKSKNILKFTSTKLSNTVAIIAVLFIMITSLRYFNVIKEPYITYKTLLIKSQSLKTHTDKYPVETETVIINNLKLTNPLNGGCRDFPLPCSGNYINNIEMRGNTLQDGFREKKNH